MLTAPLSWRESVSQEHAGIKVGYVVALLHHLASCLLLCRGNTCSLTALSLVLLSVDFAHTRLTGSPNPVVTCWTDIHTVQRH